MANIVLRSAVLALGAAVVGLAFNALRPEGIEIGRSVLEAKTEAVEQLRREKLEELQQQDTPEAGGEGETDGQDATEASASVDLSSLEFEVTLEQAVALHESGQGFFLDARPRVYYETGHIPGARLLNPTDYDAQIFDVAPELPADRPIIVYCDGGDCSASLQVAQRLVSEEGFPNVHVFEAGYPAWEQAGQRIAKGSAP
jgi:rhodanese-related sulfurtransferase